MKIPSRIITIAAMISTLPPKDNQKNIQFHNLNQHEQSQRISQ